MGLTVGAGIGEFVGRYDGMGVLLVWPAAVAQSARSVATLFRRIIVVIGPASKTDEGGWPRIIAAPSFARPPAARRCVWAGRVLPRRGAGAARRGEGAAFLAARIISAPASPVAGARPPARRAPLCVGRPRAVAAAAARRRGASAGLFWKRSPGCPAAAAAAHAARSAAGQAVREGAISAQSTYCARLCFHRS